MNSLTPIKKEIRHFHLFCGSGGGAKGFNRSHARVGTMVGEYRCIGGIDSNAAAIKDFTNIAGVPGTVMDLFDRDQYIAFHGKQPPAGWREATAEDIQRAAGYERPNIVFLSAPCKGFSGLLSQSLSTTAKYQALNRLTVRGVWLMLEAWADDPPEFVLFENVPRIANRGRALLDQIQSLLGRYGYAVAETTHDCGELGGLAQSRKRFLLVARHVEKIPPFLYEPEKKSLRAVGDILGRMPLPGDVSAGPMHRIPRLQWKTWVRLAFVEAGSDWRSLNKMVVEDGYLRDYLIVPEYHHGYLGVNRWEDSVGTIAGRSTPSNGTFSVADPRFDQSAKWNAGQAYGVRQWDQPATTVTGQQSPGQGQFSVADPRPGFSQNSHQNIYKIIPWDQAAKTVTGATHCANGLGCVADPRAQSYKGGYGVIAWNENAGTVSGESMPSNGKFAVADPRGESFSSKYKVTNFEEPAGTVISGSTTGQGAFDVADPRPPERKLFSKYAVTPWESRTGTVIGGDDTGAYAVADPRPGMRKDKDSGDHYLTGGHYGVVPWDSQSYAVAGAAKHDNGRWSVADPRLPSGCPVCCKAAIDKGLMVPGSLCQACEFPFGEHKPLPEPNQQLVAIIRALDNTWHRPFTTLELAAIQSLIEPEEYLELEGLSDSDWRERIGNLVPPAAAEAIGSVIGETLLLAWAGETFVLGRTPIWVRPVAIALSVGGGADATN